MAKKAEADLQVQSKKCRWFDIVLVRHTNLVQIRYKHCHCACPLMTEQFKIECLVADHGIGLDFLLQREWTSA
jgi:hypothetical protein